MRAVLTFVLAAGGLLACHPQQLPPHPAPTRAMPAVVVPEGSPAPGTGRVVLDADGETAQVIDEDARTLCAATPCVVDLAYGSHPVVFVSTLDRARASEVDLDVGPKAKVVRHRIGEHHDGGALQSVGFAVLVLGAVTALSGAAVWATDTSDRGPLVAGVGATLMGASLPLLVFDRPSERHGSTTEVPYETEPPAEP